MERQPVCGYVALQTSLNTKYTCSHAQRHSTRRKAICLVIIFYHCHMLLTKTKMFSSDYQTLRSLSWLIRNRFIAVIAVYGILSPLQSVGSMKESIGSTFA